MRLSRLAGMSMLVLLAACGPAEPGAESDPSTTEAPDAQNANSSTIPATTTTLQVTTTVESQVDLAAAEAFIDAFYSFDAQALAAALAFGEEYVPFMGFYQGWAEGANYKIVDRGACEATDPQNASCPITVESDFVRALGLDVNVTVTFLLTFEDGDIVEVDLTSNDPPEFNQAFDAVADDPELLGAGGACEGFFNGGPTPGDCARVFVASFEELAGSDG